MNFLHLRIFQPTFQVWYNVWCGATCSGRAMYSQLVMDVSSLHVNIAMNFPTHDFSRLYFKSSITQALSCTLRSGQTIDSVPSKIVILVVCLLATRDIIALLSYVVIVTACFDARVLVAVRRNLD